MNRDPVLFRVDGTTQTGWERFYRCMTYALALQRRRRPTYFLSQLEPNSLAMAIKRTGNDWIDADAPVGGEDDLEEMIQEIRRLRPAAVIVDAPEASEPYLRELSATGTLVVSIDNLAAIRFPSQLVINPTLAPGREAYEVTPGTQLLLGSRYALVRPEIRRSRQVRSLEPAQTSPNNYRVLIALGDDDPNHQVKCLAEMMLHVPLVEKIDLAVRSCHPDLAELQAMVEANSERMKLATEPSEISSRLSRCHFAITSGGNWSIELACIGVPQMVIVQSEVHWPTAQRLEDEGAVTCLGWHESVTPSTIRQAIQNLLTDPLERQAMTRCARKLIDGRGSDRLVTALEILLHPSREIRDMDFQEAA